MKRLAIAAAICVTLGTAGCSQATSNSGSSEEPSTSASATSERPSPSSSPSKSSSSSAQSTLNASQIAANLGCDNISTETPAGTTPNATTMVRCTLSNQGYHVLAFQSNAATTSAVRSLQVQANDTGETVTIAKSAKWIVKAAEGPTNGAPMIKSAEKQGGTKVLLY